MPDPQPPEDPDRSCPLGVYAVYGNAEAQLRDHHPPLSDNTHRHDAPFLPATAIGVSLCQADMPIGYKIVARVT